MHKFTIAKGKTKHVQIENKICHQSQQACTNRQEQLQKARTAAGTQAGRRRPPLQRQPEPWMPAPLFPAARLPVREPSTRRLAGG